MKKIILVLFLLGLFLSPKAMAQEMPAEKQLFSEAIVQDIDISTTSATLTIKAKRGALNGRVFTTSLPLEELNRMASIQKGSEVMMSYLLDDRGGETVTINDVVRKQGITILFVVFLALVIGIGRMEGVRGLISMVLSFLLLFYGLIPLITKGYNPLLVSAGIIASIIPIMFYLTHGVNTKTHIGVISSIITFLITGVLAWAFGKLLQITGSASGEAVFLQTLMQPGFDLGALFIAGIVIGVLGVLDDITISQAALVLKLYEKEKKKYLPTVIHDAMEIGRDHIASLVNTLVLVYVGSSLPLMLLFYQNTMPSFLVVNQEIIVAELMRMIVASMGVIMAVPIATYVGVGFLNMRKKKG